MRAHTTLVLAALGLPSALFGASLSGCHGSSSPTARLCTIAPATPSDWRLHTDGTRLRDELGRQVLLRGVNAGGRSKFAPYVPFDYPDGGYRASLDAYMSHAAAWGIDVMRVPFTWAALEPSEGADDADWLSRYDQLLDSAWAHGIWTVVDFHQDVYAEVFCGDGFPAWTVPDAGPAPANCSSWQLEYFNDPTVMAAFDGFWASGSWVQAAYLRAWDVIVARYKDKPGVIGFEPFNEPAAGTADESAFEATTLTNFYSTVALRMNAAAPSSLVFIDTPGIDGATLTTKLGQPSGTGVVFAPHYYPLAPDDSDESALSGLGAWAAVGTSWNAPVFVGEFATSDVAGSDWSNIPFIFDALDALGLSGTEWEYSTSQQVWNGETDSVAGPAGGDYPSAQGLQRPFARAVAGSAISQAFDSASNSFTLTFTPADAGITEVAIPSHVYPNGVNITLAGACMDTTSLPGRLLVQPDSNATSVALRLDAK